MIRSSWPLAAFIGIALLSGDVIPVRAEPEDSLRAVSSAQAAFGLRLLDELARIAPNSNISCSPMETFLLLALASRGAVGSTRAALADALCLGSMDDATLADGTTVLASLGRADLGLPSKLKQLRMLYTAPPIREEPQFQQIAEASCGITRLPMGAARRIRTEYLDPPLPAFVPAASDSIDIADTVEFRGAWRTPFHSSMTRPGKFAASASIQKNVSMMLDNNWYAYAEAPNYQFVQVSFAGLQYYMAILLPKAGCKLADVVQTLTASAWSNLNTRVAFRQGDLSLPRMTLGGEQDLSRAVANMGARRAFTPLADFRRLTRSPARLSHVIQRTRLRIDESGAAPVLAPVQEPIIRSQVPIEPSSPFSMTVNRPFLCAIVDRSSGALVHLSLVYDPGRN